MGSELRSGEADRWEGLEREAYRGGKRKADIDYVVDIIRNDWYVAKRISTMMAWGLIPTAEDQEGERRGRSPATWRDVVGCELCACCAADDDAVISLHE